MTVTPLTVPMPVATIIVLVAIGIAYVVTSTFLQRKLTNPKRMREIQAKIQSISKEMNALVKNKAAQEEIAAKQKELMPLMSENMKVSFKPMLALLPIFLLLYYVLLPAGFKSVASDYVVLFGLKLGYLGLFFATVLILGLAKSVVIMIYDRKKAREERQVLETANMSQEGT